MQTAKWIILSLLCFTLQASALTVITTIQPGGMTISLPDTYVFGNDITWSPTGNGQAILIDSDDVTLDLQDFTLQSTTTAFNTKGILVTTANNLVIKNGTIANMGLCGIECDTCSNILIQNVTVDGLNKNDIVDYTVPTGILVSDSTLAIINGCTVKNIDVTTASSAAIQLTATKYSSVTNCLVQNLINRDGSCTGIGHLLCDFAVLESCVINGLQSEFVSNLNTSGHTAIGIIPVSSTNLLINNCAISNITGCCDDAHGISVFECVGAIVNECDVKNVLDGAGPLQTGAKATGIEIYSSGVEVIKCSAKNITAINPQDKQATGFSCAQCIGVKFYKCHAENVNVYDENGNQSSTLGYGTGFGWAPDPRPEFIAPAVDILYSHCTAKKCQVGFDSWFHINSIWDHIHAKHNKIGVLDVENSERTFSGDACSECGCHQTGCYPTPLTVTVQNVARNNKFLHVSGKIVSD